MLFIAAQNVDPFSFSTQTWTHITGISQAISLTSSSKVLVSVSSMASGASGIMYRIDRGGTVIGTGTAAGSRPLVTWGATDGLGGQNAESVSFEWLDTHGTSGSVTYKIQVRCQTTNPAAVHFLNRQVTDSDNSFYPRGVTVMTLTEIGA